MHGTADGRRQSWLKLSVVGLLSIQQFIFLIVRIPWVKILPGKLKAVRSVNDFYRATLCVARS